MKYLISQPKYIMNNKTINREEAPLRYQSLYGKTIELRDVSEFFVEKAALSKPDIDTILAARLFKQDEVVLGVGRPNVFLLIPDGKGNHIRYAAKSCWRAPSKLERTRGTIQSGIFMVLKGLTQEQIEKVMLTAETHEGEKSRTCVNANARVMDDAGITLGNDENINDVQLPITMFDLINTYGLKIDGEPIDIEILNTTKNTLEKQAWETRKAVYFTLFRHVQRALNIKANRKEYNDKQKTDKKDRYVMKDKKEHKRDFHLNVSNVSRLAVPLRLLWGPHTIFTLKQNRVDINDYFSDKLEPYPDKKPNFFTKIKKNILFNDSVVSFINKFMQKGNSEFSGKSESDFHNMFEVNEKYNIVVSSSGIMVAKINIKNKFVDWLLSKHVLISNYNEDVRFAGEVWKDNKGIIWINNDSGTYKPSLEKLESFIKYSKEIFPHIDIRKEEKNS